MSDPALQLAAFRADITPPIGHPLCAGWYPSATGVANPLSANGIVLLPEGELPIVLCALDWAELSNGEYDLWRERLAATAGTSPDRVAVHCTHCHDAPWPDRDAQDILDQEGYPNVIMWRPWADAALENVCSALRHATPNAELINGVRAGRAPVHQIASNRRLLGSDGKVKGVRWTRCRDAVLRAEPDGLIDSHLKTISFYKDDRKVAALHYYAVHPTSHDGTGSVTCEFVGLARDRLMAEEGVPHIYFTECAGNITTGKYNDGAGDYRELFSNRIYDAMIQAGKNAVTCPSFPVEWRVAPLLLPLRSDQKKPDLLALIRDPLAISKTRSRAALILAYQRRYEAGRPIPLSALCLGSGIIILHTPGEAFIEYQLFAQKLAPDAIVAVPSYGDCGPGYITLERSFEEGGYEPRDSFCSGDSETLMRRAIESVLHPGQ
jgi:hypothetical protein